MTINSISPIDGSLYAQRTAATEAQIDAALERARSAQRAWREVPLGARVAIMARFGGIPSGGAPWENGN